MSSPAQQQPEHPVSGTAADFGATLKARRNKTGRSLQALSQRVKLSTSTLSRYENGQSLPSRTQLATILDTLEVPHPERLDLLRKLERARADPPADRHTTSPTAPQLSVAGSVAGAATIRRRWRDVPRVTMIAFAVIGVTILGSLIFVTSADPHPEQTGPNSAPESCGRFTVAARDLHLRDFYGASFAELQRGDAVTVIRRGHPNGLPYWEVSTATHQQGWVDHGYLRPAC